ncbi:MAG TPA: isochorismatase family protein [Acidimicrobiales bacterium]|nr:isochorismatase family protein [Acidimicrobiales bacterium]
MKTVADTALLIMDVQVGVVDRFVPGATVVLAPIARAAAAARAAGVPVVHVRVGFRPGMPEVSRRNRAFAPLRASGGLGLDDPTSAIHPAVAPEPGDVVVVKKRIGAFTGSDLEVVLRSLDVGSVVLEKVFPAQAAVLTSARWVDTVEAGADGDAGSPA